MTPRLANFTSRGACWHIGCGRLAVRLAITVTLLPCMALAQTPVTELPPVEVVGTGLLPGLPDLAKVPANAQTFDRGSLARDGYPSALKTLDETAAGVTLDQAQNNPWQPDLIYRGFEASPLVGNAQGLATYLNGSRFNQPFGDTTNWDLIPDIAIDRLDLVGSNPAFGLNALGGAVSIQMKNGFTYHGGEAEVLGGSFGRIQGSIQYGLEKDNTSAYIAGTVTHENGWRDFSPSDLKQLYGDIGWRSDRAELHFNIVGADNDLIGNGTTPVDLLSQNRGAIFTHPDETMNKYIRLGLSGSVDITDATTVKIAAYYSNLSQRTLNGDAAGVAPCDDDGSVICMEGGGGLTTTGAAPIPNFVQNSPYVTQFGFSNFRAGGPYSFLNQTATDTSGFGIQTQIEQQFDVLGMANHLTYGASYDGGLSEFTASTRVGGLSPDRGFIGPGIIVSQVDGSITPVRAHTTNNYYGLFVTDSLDLTSRLTGTVSLRFNSAQIQLRDEIGTALNGVHAYNRLNPAVGFTYKILPNLTAYAGYAETNRAPTPAELSCADPLAPCSLTNFFVGDPDLKQVVAHTFEVGLRGVQPIRNGRMSWNFGLFRTDTNDDILFVSSTTAGRAFFQNVGTTRRQGIEASVQYQQGKLRTYANYALTDATFQTGFVLNSEDNPQASPDGTINVRSGNRIPGIPRHMFKVGMDYDVTPGWTVGVSAKVASGKYLVGDESNLNDTTGSYGVLNAHTSYQVTRSVQVFALLENVLNATYATFGTFSPVNSDTPLIQAPNSTNTRSLSLAPPISAFGGLRVTF